ncbi:MAG TPA: DUF1566 domain-containing protein [Bacteroidales bacterium]|nr:DUF1566 domain-containing protein [Bacteroidales bacterium]
MKKIFLFLTVFIFELTIYAQAPEKMTYQAVVRDSSGVLITKTIVGMQISILQGSVNGNPVYTEILSPMTNKNGLVTVEIGGGGGFNTIDWSNGPYFIRVEIDPSGATDYTISGTSEILSVPFALYARTSETVKNEMDPLFAISVASGILNSDIINWNNKLSSEVDGSVTNEIQGLSIHNDTVFLSDGGFIILPSGFDGNYNSLINKPINLSSFINDVGYLTSYTEADGSVTNELQALSIYHDTIFLTNGGFVKLPAGFDGNYNSLTNKPTNVSSFDNDAGYLTSYTEVDGSVTNELQILTIHHDTIFLSNGGFAKLPAGFDGHYSSLTGAPTNVSAFANDAGYLTAEVDGSLTNELQTVTRIGSVITLSNGGGSFTDSVVNYTAGAGIDISGNIIKTKTYTVGEFARGGIVFWVDETGQHGLVCAKTDQDGGSGIRWHGGTYTNTMALGDGPLSGTMNTAIIIGNQGYGDGATYAARICSELQITESGKTYGDWYLPTKEELNLLYQNKDVIDATAIAHGGTAFAVANYWSSTEYNNGFAWMQYFSTGNQNMVNKANPNRVRAIRSF